MTENPAEPDGTVAGNVVLNAIEARLLGCLIEKAATTPDVYPLTVNAAQLACNQKTNREPIISIELGDVGHALHTLEEKGLVRVVHGARALRYEHTIDAAMNLTARARAVVALLLLRGAQTQGELLTRSERLADFPDVESLKDTLDRLIMRVPALVVRVGRGSGQREDRYMHLLSGPPSMETFSTRSDEPRVTRSSNSDLEARIEVLERALAEIQQRLAASDGSRPGST